MNEIPPFTATGIGSMPFVDPKKAVQLSLSSLPQMPFWPQLPRMGFQEQMEVQYCEKMPCAIIEEEKKRLYFETSHDYSELFAAFYESYMAAMDPDSGNGDCSSLAITEKFAHGLYAFKTELGKRSEPLPFIKVQTIGPCSFSLTVVDENKRAIYYNEEFRDMIVKALAMKCRWQIAQFASFAGQVVCFIDEPILSAFGSSTYVSVKRDDVISVLQEVISAIHADHAIAGIHCCGNTEWSILVEAGVDIINFDAFSYGQTIAMYPDAIQEHLERGGYLAWGIVPTSQAIREQSVESLIGRLENWMELLASKGIKKEKILQKSLITPSCGTGSMEPQDAEMIFQKMAAISQELRNKYGK